MIPLFKPFLDVDNIMINVRETLESGNITEGKVNKLYESKLREFFDHPYLLTLNSATSGLTLALRLLENVNGPVLCTPMTCFATTSALLANNRAIKWVDTDPETCNIDLNDLGRKITAETQIIVVVHWGGVPVDMEKLHFLILQKEVLFGIKIHVIEDCAHSFGALYCDRMLGTRQYAHYAGGGADTFESNICVYSTQAIKHLTTVDGGFILLPNEDMYERCRLLRWYGIDRELKLIGDYRLENDISEPGYKYHMNDIDASIGLANLPHIPGNLDRAREIAEFYDQELGDLQGLEIIERPPNTSPSFWLYTIKVDDRDQFVDFMRDQGITTSQVHKRNDLHSCVNTYRDPQLPGVDELSARMVCIPIGWWLADEDVDYIVNTVIEWTSTLTILPLNVKDKAQYLGLLGQLSGHNYSLTDDEWLKHFINGINGDINCGWYHGKMIASYKILREDKFGDNVLHIEDVVVDKEWRGRGIGRQMMCDCIKVCNAADDVYKIVLNCTPDLYSFYHKVGFTTNGLQCSIYLK